MKTDAFYRSRYMKAATFDAPITATIAGFRSEEMSDGTHKPVLTFADGDLPDLVLNKTNLGTLQAALGVESDSYIGHRVRISRVVTSFQGKPTPGLSLRVLQKSAPAKPIGDDLDDAIDF